MKYNIIYDKPGRLRLRCGAYAFEKRHEAYLLDLIGKCSYVVSAEVHSENGGILVCYRAGFRQAVLDLIAGIGKASLQTISTPEDDIRKIDDTYKGQLCGMVLRRCLKRLLLPAPIRHIMTFVRGLSYVARGISTLLGGELTVDVLDGASVGACLLQGNYQTAATIMFLLRLSSILEDYSHARTKAVLRDSLMIRTEQVWLVTEEQDILIPMSRLQAGDVIRIRTGNLIPVDGEVTAGEAYVNEASMTGEPLPVMKTEGKTVFAGTVVEEGAIAVRVRALASETRINRIAELIDSAEELKADVQSRAERLADGIVPFSFLGFGLMYLLTGDLTKAVSVLMVDYSCAIKLSAPISVISAMKEAADRNITVKGGKYLEEYALADTVVFDKTGTLTNAQPKLEQVLAFGELPEDEVLRIAACLEEHFPHSVARAIVAGAAEKGLVHEEEHAEVEYIVAHGIASTLHGERVVIGSRHFVMEDEHVLITKRIQNQIDKKAGASSVIYLAIGGRLEGVLCISDPPRLEAAETIRALKESGIRNIVMLTGDSQKAAEITAEKLGITTVYSQVLPEQKYAYVEQMKQSGSRIIMVGDGINDAPALAAANVSVAMSDASDIARETADITISNSDLTGLLTLRHLSALLMQRISDHYRFILWFNSALLLAGITGIMSPGLSAFLHNASTMLICVKSMSRLEKREKQDA